MCVCVCVVCVCVFSLARETSQLERDNLELKDQIAARDAEIQSLRRYASRVPHNQWTLVRIATVESHLYHLLLLLTMPFTHTLPPLCSFRHSQLQNCSAQMQCKQDVIDSLEAALADAGCFSKEYVGQKPARLPQNQPARKIDHDPGECEWEARRKEQLKNTRLRSRGVDAGDRVFNWSSHAAPACEILEGNSATNAKNWLVRKNDPGEREWEARRKEQRENARLRSRGANVRDPVFNWLSPAANLEGFQGRFSA